MLTTKLAVVICTCISYQSFICCILRSEVCACMTCSLVCSVVMADTDEEKKLLDSTQNGNGLEVKDIELSVSSEITRGTFTLA